MDVHILPLVPDAVLPQPSPAATRSPVPHGYGVQEQCLPFTAAAALGLLVRAPLAFGLCQPSEVPAGAHPFTSPVKGPANEGRADARVFYVVDDSRSRFVGNGFTFDSVSDRDRGTYAPVAPGISFFDRENRRSCSSCTFRICAAPAKASTRCSSLRSIGRRNSKS